MNKVIVIPKTEYQKILQNQRELQELRSRVNALEKVVEENLEEEVRPSVLKKWERISRGMDKGKGKEFKNIKEFKKYLDNL